MGKVRLSIGYKPSISQGIPMEVVDGSISLSRTTWMFCLPSKSIFITQRDYLVR